jgi:purine-nucleoside phosphorylase
MISDPTTLDTVEQFRAKRDDAVADIRSHSTLQPEVLIILGTGLGKLVEELEIETTIPYESIRHFPQSTVESHAGKLHMATLGGKRVMVMQGRFHYYEGYTMQQIAFPVRVASALGANKMIVSNACGCLNPEYRRGELMLISDHINLLGDNPLIGANDPDLGPRFPDMSDPYNKQVRSLVKEVAATEGIELHEGVYAAMSGPMLETRAEYRMLRTMGADVIGMSTIPEVIAAVHLSMDVMGCSVITDECFPDTLAPLNIEHVLAAASSAEPSLTKLVKSTLERW